MLSAPFISGIGSAEGFAIDASGRIFVPKHGRDQLRANWPNVYKPEQEATLPSEGRPFDQPPTKDNSLDDRQTSCQALRIDFYSLDSC